MAAVVTSLLVDVHGRPMQLAVDRGPTLRRVARGGSGTLINQGFIDDLEYNPELRGTKWVGEPGRLGIAGRMMRDPHVRASVSYVVDALCAAKWRFKSATKRPIDIEAADYCQRAIVERQAFRQLVRRIARSYMVYGYSLHEMLDDYEPISTERFPLHPGDGQGIVPTGFDERPAWTIYQWIRQRKRTARLAGVRQRLWQASDNEPTGEVYIPADRLVRVTWDQEGGNFLGLAPLRSAYYPWKLKLALQSIDAIKHERLGVGVPTMTIGEDATEADIAAAEIVLAEMRANEKGFLILPNGWAFEWEGAGEDRGSNLNLAIQRCNIDIAFNVVAGHRLLGLTNGGSAGGSYALAYTQEGGHHLHIDNHASEVAMSFWLGNDGWSPARRITDVNYGADAETPVLEARALPTRNWQDIVNQINASVAAKTITMDDQVENDVREFLELGPHDPSTARSAEETAVVDEQTDDTDGSDDADSEEARAAC